MSLGTGMSVSIVVREGHACLGIDLHSTLGTPSGECLRIDYGANNSDPLLLSLGFEALGFLLPLTEGVGQDMLVRHDLKNGRIIVFGVPSNSGDRDLHFKTPNLACLTNGAAEDVTPSIAADELHFPIASSGGADGSVSAPT